MGALPLPPTFPPPPYNPQRGRQLSWGRGEYGVRGSSRDGVQDLPSPATATATSTSTPASNQSTGHVGVLLGLAALSGASAMARRVIGRFRGGGIGVTVAGEQNGVTNAQSTTTSAMMITAPGAPQQWYRWHIELLELSIESETEQPQAALPPVKRSLSISAPTEGGGGVLGPGARRPTLTPDRRDTGAAGMSATITAAITTAATLPSPTGQPHVPHHIELLIQQYPKLITRDVAHRFITGIGNDNKAFSALSSMAHWMTENRLTDVLHRPQPVFSTMKRHYPHAFLGWSTQKDCLVELECMGRWPRAYDAIATEGVSEQAMLEHLLFTYMYAFHTLDPRPLPHGKTVKIVDLEGLTMSDLRTPGFKLITRVGAMLSMNFPQRLHRCFLINAPGWWAVAWRLISPLIPAKVRGQMSLFGKSDKEAAARAMAEWVDASVLPVQYGGKNTVKLDELAMEVGMKKYVDETLLKGVVHGGSGSGTGTGETTSTSLVAGVSPSSSFSSMATAVEFVDSASSTQQ